MSHVAGCLIKNQLVTHLTLGIALRCVLDALRKPADSKVRCFSSICVFSMHPCSGGGKLKLDIFATDVCVWYQGFGEVCQSSG